MIICASLIAYSIVCKPRVLIIVYNDQGEVITSKVDITPLTSKVEIKLINSSVAIASSPCKIMIVKDGVKVFETYVTYGLNLIRVGIGHLTIVTNVSRRIEIIYGNVKRIAYGKEVTFFNVPYTRITVIIDHYKKTIYFLGTSKVIINLTKPKFNFVIKFFTLNGELIPPSVLKVMSETNIKISRNLTAYLISSNSNTTILIYDYGVLVKKLILNVTDPYKVNYLEVTLPIGKLIVYSPKGSLIQVLLPSGAILSKVSTNGCVKFDYIPACRLTIRCKYLGITATKEVEFPGYAIITFTLEKDIFPQIMFVLLIVIFIISIIVVIVLSRNRGKLRDTKHEIVKVSKKRVKSVRKERG